MFRKKQDADDQAVKVKQLAAEVEQLQAAIAEMSKLKTDKETKLENTMRYGSKWWRYIWNHGARESNEFLRLRWILFGCGRDFGTIISQVRTELEKNLQLAIEK